MTKVKINLTSVIKQKQDSETFKQALVGELIKDGPVYRISYQEDDGTPVKMLYKKSDLIIRRGLGSRDYSQLHFVLGERKPCRYLVSGRQMDLATMTNLLEFTEQKDGSKKLIIEYALFSGLYLIGNYAVTLIFT